MSKHLKKKFMHKTSIAPKIINLDGVSAITALIKVLSDFNSWDALGLSVYSTLKYLNDKENLYIDDVGDLLFVVNDTFMGVIFENPQNILEFSPVIIQDDSRELLCEYALKLACECGLVEGINFKIGDFVKSMSLAEKVKRIVGDINLTQKGLNLLDKLSSASLFNSAEEYSDVCEGVAKSLVEELELIVNNRLKSDLNL